MAIKKLAPKLLIGVPPLGSIVLDELLRRYLISIGLKKYQSLFSVLELQQFALLTVFYIVQKNGFENLTAEDFCAWVRPGDAYSRVRLLPDTEEARLCGAEQLAKRQRNEDGEETVVLRKVKYVKSYISRTFLNLLKDELRIDKHQRDTESKLRDSNPSSVRRAAQNEDGHQALDESIRHFRERREGADIEATRFVMRSIEKSMSSRSLDIIRLLFDGNKPREVARILQVGSSEIHKVYREYLTNFKRKWSRLFENE